MRFRLLVAAAALGVALVPAVAAAPSAQVTLEVRRVFDQAYGRFRLEFSGTTTGGANEYVTVMAEKCGQRFATAVAGGVTRADGSWEDTYRAFAFGGTATYRARWRGHVSDPVTVRGQLQPVLVRRPRGRFWVSFAADANLSGRLVELQRLAGGRWVRVRRATLEPLGGAGYGTGFRAEFRVRTRGLTLRIVVPANSAAPCYPPAVTPTFRS